MDSPISLVIGQCHVIFFKLPTIPLIILSRKNRVSFWLGCYLPSSGMQWSLNTIVLTGYVLTQRIKQIRSHEKWILY